MPNVGPWEVLLLLLVLLLIFGPKRLPEMGRSVGRGIREFKDSLSGRDDEPASTALPPPSAQASAVSGESARESETVSRH